MRQPLRDWSLRLALQVGLLLEVVQVLLEAAVAVAALAANWSQAVAVPAQPAAGLPQQDSSAPEHPDSYLRLPEALVLEVELVRAKPTRTRVRDR